MFSAEEIQARLRRQPFQPLRIVASEGQRFDVYHPDLVMVGRRDVSIGFASPGHPTVYDRLIRIALVHIVGLEDLPVPTPPGNGQQ